MITDVTLKHAQTTYASAIVPRLEGALYQGERGCSGAHDQPISMPSVEIKDLIAS